MIKVFFSYSHKDEELRDELEIHLAALKRGGLLDVWHDRRIGAGEEFDSSIREHIEDADVILMLISAYFINSNYCYDIEVKRALERHEAASAQVIPVILRHCDWKELPFGRINASPRDGKPITSFSDIHEGFLQVIEAIKEAAKRLDREERRHTSHPEIQSSPAHEKIALPRSSNLGIRKTFTQEDKDRFLQETFDYLSEFFEGSLEELKKRNPEVGISFQRISPCRFMAVFYRNGDEQSRCNVWYDPGSHFPGGIAYNSGRSQTDQSYNEFLSADDDGHMLFLRPMGMPTLGTPKKEMMSVREAGEYYWELFIRYLK